MPKFQKKPIIIEAWQWTGWYDDATREYSTGNAQEIIAWAGPAQVIKLEFDPCGDFGLLIPTLEGDMYASYKDWIIKGIKGEFYPCKPDIFADSYELVED